MLKFSLGRLVATRSVSDLSTENSQFAKDVSKALGRYRNCDWGELCLEDVEQNNEAVRTGEDRILAVYSTSEGKIWIITEWDRSYTTILFPSEY